MRNIDFFQTDPELISLSTHGDGDDILTFDTFEVEGDRIEFSDSSTGEVHLYGAIIIDDGLRLIFENRLDIEIDLIQDTRDFEDIPSSLALDHQELVTAPSILISRKIH